METVAVKRNNTSRGSSSLNRKSWRAFTRWLMDHGYESCQICGVKDNLTFDHIFPWIRGGTNEMHNMAILCKSCNEGKGSRIVKLDHCVWPNPHLPEKRFVDLVVGDRTMFGIVAALQYISVDNKDIVIAKFSGYCPMLEISRLLRKDKKFKETNIVSRTFNTKICMYPGE